MILLVNKKGEAKSLEPPKIMRESEQFERVKSNRPSLKNIEIFYKTVYDDHSFKMQLQSTLSLFIFV